MQIQEKTRILRLAPGENNPRNSEGDFIRLPDGNVMFAFSRFTGKSYFDDAATDIAAVTLSADGKSVVESEPRLLVRAAEYNETNVMSVTLLPMANGDIGLFYLVRRVDGTPDDYGRCSSVLDLLLRRSADGKVFPKEGEVLCSGNYRAYYVVNNQRVIRTSTGRLIFPAAEHRASYLAGKAELVCDGTAVADRVFYSDDDGKTWNEAPKGVSMPALCNTYTGLQEPGIVEMPNGVLRLWARTDLGCQYESFSYDNGEHWTPAAPSAFSAPSSPMKIARNPFSGKYYAIYNPIPNYQGRVDHTNDTGWGRTPIVIAESGDGINFSSPVAIDDDPSHGYCYPAVYFLNEKEMLVSFCDGGKEDGICLSSTAIWHLTVD